MPDDEATDDTISFISALDFLVWEANRNHMLDISGILQNAKNQIIASNHLSIKSDDDFYHILKAFKCFTKYYLRDDHQKMECFTEAIDKLSDTFFYEIVYEGGNNVSALREAGS